MGKRRDSGTSVREWESNSLVGFRFRETQLFCCVLFLVAYPIDDQLRQRLATDEITDVTDVATDDVADVTDVNTARLR